MSANGGMNGDVNGGGRPPTVDNNDIEDLEKKELELKRKERDPPIVFHNTINVGLLCSQRSQRICTQIRCI